ncbi:MAG: peptidoglycan DD-metalloendopeptidase family protein [Lewinellaceae bacterium]|nr:peptidoglycan DD-metalloendopeptidase family protein [Saprospiraceae bacterium]MCB9343490.1 peptidoglycan DD-metalloendopeptidase family protein [Lewinellaceae bacterium]
MQENIHIKLLTALYFCVVSNNLNAQCFPSTLESCASPATIVCSTSPSSASSCSSSVINRNFSGSINSGTYYAPDSEIRASGSVSSSSSVTFQAGREVILEEGFSAIQGSDFKATYDPVLEQFSPVLLTSSNFNDYGNANYNHEDLGYDYGFEIPLRSPVVNCSSYINNYKANMNNLYFLSIFGPRYLSDDFDFHQGSDFVDRKYQSDSPDPALNRDIICMCEGEVVEKDPSDGTIKVRCKDVFNKPQLTGSNVWTEESFGEGCSEHYINIAYRHLESFEPCIQVGKLIKKGDKIGVMGKTDATNYHLHLSVQRKVGSSSTFKNVHPMRIFRPSQIHLLKTLDNSAVKIYRLKPYTSGDDEAIFRFVFSYDHVAIRYLEFEHGGNTLTYDFEAVSAGICSGSGTFESPNCVDGIKLYPYAFNRGTCAYGRYISSVDKMPGTFPASPLYSGGTYYPLLQSAPYDKPNYVLDVVVDLDEFSGLSNLSNLNIKVVDIYGKGVQAHP